MSEYKPITGELRTAMVEFNGEPAMRLDVFNRCCDAIDSVHAQLERENAALKAELDRAHDEWDFWESTHIELPKDADGECICAGDELDGYGKTIEVVELRYGRSGWVLISRDGNAYADTFAFTHHHTPTVEDVLTEFAYGLGVPVADSYVAAAAAKLRLAGDAE